MISPDEPVKPLTVECFQCESQTKHLCAGCAVCLLCCDCDDDCDDDDDDDDDEWEIETDDDEEEEDNDDDTALASPLVSVRC